MRSASPLAQAVAKRLRTEILEGRLSSGRALPSERELADQNSVSRTVVRAALSLLVREGLITAGGGGRPVIAERPTNVRSTRSRDVGVWLWPFTDEFAASSILRGIQHGLEGSGARLVVGSARLGSWESTLESEAKFLHDLANDEQAIGAILWYLGGEKNLPVLLEAKNRGLQLVFVDRRPPAGIEGDFVGTENRGSAQRAVAHLVELGHRRIACVKNNDPVSSVADRVAGYKRALGEAGLNVHENHILKFAPHAGEADLAAMLRLAKRIADLGCTAVFAVNDSVALLLLDAFQQLGITVPAQMSVVGFDGLLRWVPGGGTLTTAVQDFNRVGEYAAELFFDRVRHEANPSYRHILIEAPLMVAGTTAAVRGDLAPGDEAGNKWSPSNHAIS